jgi:hypothetical protein
MKRVSLFTAVAFMAAASSAFAGSVGEFNFSFMSTGGSIVNDSVNGFAQNIGPPNQMDPFAPEITSLELEVNGIQFQNWADLDIYLFSPRGEMIELMTDRGDGFSNIGAGAVDLMFTDLALSPVPTTSPVVSGEYRPEGLANGTDDGFATYVGMSGGTDAWLLLMIDDGGATGGGSFSNWVLRGTAVPEPATLSLLALGAVALIRRTRRRA